MFLYPARSLYRTVAHCVELSAVRGYFGANNCKSTLSDVRVSGRRHCAAVNNGNAKSTHTTVKQTAGKSLVQDATHIAANEDHVLKKAIDKGCLLWVSGITTPKKGPYDLLWHFAQTFESRGVSGSGIPNYEDRILRLAKEVAEIKMIVPQAIEGGVYVVVGSKAQGAALIRRIGEVQGKLKCFEVNGEPFVHDVMGLSPSIRIHMKNSKGTSMTLETIYGHARKYGHIRNIEPHTPYTDKVYVTYHRSIDAAAAMKCMNRIPIQSIVPEANGQLPTLCMVYEPPIRFNVWNFVMNHTKLVVPAVIAVTGFLSYTLFEPIRVWFVEQNIRYFTKLRKTYAKGMNMLGNTTTQLTQYFGYRGVSGDEDKGGVSEQKLRLAEAIGSIAEELTERVNESFIEDSGALVVIAGPPGSGKSFVAHHLIENASHMLFIDFSDHTVRGQPNSSYIESKLIRSTGYFPSVLWMNRLVKLSEGIATATMGIKTEGLSSTSLDSTRSILNTLTNALVKFRAAHPQTDDELLEMAVEETDTGEGEQEGMAGATESVLGDEKADKEKGVLDTVLSRFRAYEEIGKVEKPADGVLETVAGYTHTVTDPIVTLAAPITNLVSGSNSAKEETNKDEMAQKRAAPKPKVKGVPTGVVIVIEGLDRNLTDKFPWLMDVLFEWVSQMNLQHADCARVVMVTSDSQLAEDAANAMATPVHLVPMRDLPVDQAAELLSSLSTRDVSKDKLKRAIGTIGGRFNDIQLLSKRINVGMDVESATVMMVEEAVDFLRNHGLSISPLGKGKANAWTVEQMWYIITKLAENDSVPLDEVLFSPLFGGDMQPIRAMVEQRMLTVEGPHDSHNKYLVKPIRPVLGAACKELVKDERLSKAMTGKMYATQINKVNTTMQQLEDEMQKLLALGAGAWTGNGTALNDRLKYVTEQISAQSKKMRDLQARKPL